MWWQSQKWIFLGFALRCRYGSSFREIPLIFLDAVEQCATVIVPSLFEAKPEVPSEVALVSKRGVESLSLASTADARGSLGAFRLIFSWSCLTRRAVFQVSAFQVCDSTAGLVCSRGISREAEKYLSPNFIPMMDTSNWSGWETARVVAVTKVEFSRVCPTLLVRLFVSRNSAHLP